MNITKFIACAAVLALAYEGLAQTRPASRPRPATRPKPPATEPGPTVVAPFRIRSVLPYIDEAGKTAPNKLYNQVVTIPVYEALIWLRVPDKILDGPAIGDLEIKSITTDKGEDLTKTFEPILQIRGHHPTHYLNNKFHEIVYGISTTKSLPPGTTGLWVEGVMRPWTLDGNPVESEKVDFAPELGNTVKTGPFSLVLKQASGDTQAMFQFEVNGPVRAIKYVNFYNAAGETSSSNIPLVDRNRQTARINAYSYKVPDPNKCSVTYLDACKRLEIPFRVALPSAQILAPDPAATNAATQPQQKRPALQLSGVTINYFAEDPDSDLDILPARTKSAVTLHMAAAVDGRHIVRTGAPGMRIENFLIDGKKPQEIPDVTAMPAMELWGYYRFPQVALRTEMPVDARINFLPASSVQRGAIAGDLGLKIGSEKTKKIVAENVQLEKGKSFGLDGDSIAISNAALSVDRFGRTYGMRVNLMVPPDLKWKMINAQVEDAGKLLPTHFEPPYVLTLNPRPKPVNPEHPVQFNFEGPAPEKPKLTFTLFESLDEIRLPFNFEIGLGPGAAQKPKADAK